MYTIKFFYTDSISFKATNVIDINPMVDNIEYTQNYTNKSGSIMGKNIRSVDTYDLLYAVVKHQSTGIITILPGLYDNFCVTPKGESVYRQQNIEYEAKRVAAERAAKAPERKAKEKAKYQARREARKKMWIAENGQPTVTTASGTPVPQASQAPNLKAVQPVKDEVRDAVPNDAYEQLMKAGISSNDIEIIRNLQK